MKVQQISVFIENRAGRLAAVARLLGNAQVNIRALSVADTSDFGILRLIVNNPQQAAETLKDAGYTVTITDVVAMEVTDAPGGLAGVLEALDDAGINVEYLYAFVEKSGDKAIVVFRFENMESALDVLSRSGFPVLSAEQLASF